ncbi:MAG: DUF2164 domain-containing protein [Eubacteriales bacterium]
MRKKDPITLSKEKKAAMAEVVKLYFFEERDEELGDLAASLFVDFVVEKLAPEFYNQGVYDAYRFLNERCEEVLGIQI